MKIDWQGIEPSARDVGVVEDALAGLLHPSRERLVLSRRGSGFEARLLLDVCDQKTSVKLHAESLPDVVDRVAELVRIVASNRPR